MPYHQVLMARHRVRLLFVCETGLLVNWLTLLLITAPMGLQAVAWAYVLGSAMAVGVYVLALPRVYRCQPFTPPFFTLISGISLGWSEG